MYEVFPQNASFFFSFHWPSMAPKGAVRSDQVSTHLPHRRHKNMAWGSAFQTKAIVPG